MVPVRAAAAHQSTAVRGVIAEAYEEYRSAVPAGWFEPYLANVLDLEARAEVCDQLVVVAGDRVAATVSFFASAADEGIGWPRQWAGVRGLAVGPAHRGTGLGRLLMEECRRRALEGGAEVLALHTAAFMPAAVALYTALGYRRAPGVELLVDGTVLGVEVDDPPLALAYTLTLTP